MNRSDDDDDRHSHGHHSHEHHSHGPHSHGHHSHEHHSHGHHSHEHHSHGHHSHGHHSHGHQSHGHHEPEIESVSPERIDDGHHEREIESVSPWQSDDEHHGHEIETVSPWRHDAHAHPVHRLVHGPRQEHFSLPKAFVGLFVLLTAAPYLIGKTSADGGAVVIALAIVVLFTALFVPFKGRAGVGALALWYASIAAVGMSHARDEAADTRAQRAIEEDERFRDAQEARGREQLALEQSRARQQLEAARQALVATDLAKPIGERVERAIAGLLEDTVEEAVEEGDPEATYLEVDTAPICYARSVLATPHAPSRALTARMKALRRLESRTTRRALAALQRNIESARGVICRDGSDDDCLCHESHAGCCEGAGGVARCEEFERAEIECMGSAPAL